MYESKTFIDFDGVIFDTEKRIVDKKSEVPDMSWEDFFKNLDWFKLLEEAKIINNSINYILEAQELSKQIAILSKVHTLLEMEAKIKLLRNKNIEIPVFFVPPHIRKSQIYLPNSKNDILIDDSIKNLVDWEQNGGTGIYFNENININNQFETVNSLKRIL